MNQDEIIQSFLKGRKFEVGRESVRKDGIYRKISDSGEKSKQWKLIQKHNEDKKRFSKILEAITNFFGADKKDAKFIPKREYDSNKIEDKGISIQEWTRHFTKYFESKSQIDAKFHQEKNATETNSTIIENKNNSNQVTNFTTNITNQNTGKPTFKKSIFKILYDLYGDGNGKSNRDNESNNRVELSNSTDKGSGMGLSKPTRDGESGQIRTDTGKSALFGRKSGNGSSSRVSSDERITKEESLALSVADKLNTFRGLWSKKKQNEINLECKKILSTTPPEQITSEQKEILRLYEGSGGQTTNAEVEANRGMLYQFLTPTKVVEKMQDILSRYVNEGDKGMEPSAGIGRFADGKGGKYNWDMMEYNPDDKTAFSIAKILNPEAIGILTSDTKNKKAKDPELGKQGLSRFTEISQQFNSAKHPCKILIGSDVIKEGVSLNNNTIAAYNASIDWNPTTEVQKRGRHHRPGNLQKNVQWIDILMEDSIDSKLYQKQSEKISRINQIFEKSGSAAIDVSDINPEELKTDIIRDPKRKAQFIVNEEAAKVRQEAKELQGKSFTLQGIVDEIRELRNTVQNEERWLSEEKKDLKENVEEFNKLKKKGRSESYGPLSEFSISYQRKKVQDLVTSLSINKAKLQRNEENLERKGLSDLVKAESAANKLMSESDKLSEKVREILGNKKEEYISKFTKELAEKEKNKAKESIDSIVYKHVRELLSVAGINEFRKSLALNSEIRNRITLKRYLKSAC
ncbi:helicase-related protein [Leptospira adleri]|uniref:Helicase C-terminal domain-containing protein n=1 Tax=Leptospira adleri TaxID=2023186 RepID=A0A2M9YJC2_9LEPT|nr:helicase-related protein [Leptospira adleri]PJZ51639.1 hypothetical protein CH380_19100 [Leptospira adleri]PJZ61945.1 hypothetical protein CH376_11070 [Leptospira adleri]